MKIDSKPVLFIFLLTVLFASCQTKDGANAAGKFSGMDLEKVLSINIPDMLSPKSEGSYQMEIRVPENIDNEVLMSDVIDSVWYVKLGNIPSDLMSDFLMNIEIQDNRIYIRDATQKQVYVFDIKGEFLFAKYPLGEGPAEFKRAGSISVNTYLDQLVIHDDGLSKVLYYTLDGEFIREQKVGYRFLHHAYVNDSLIAVDLNKTNNGHLQEISNNQLVLADTAWKVLATGGAYDAEKERGLFFTGNVFNRSEDKLFYLQPFTYTVYQIDQDKLIPYCRLDFGKRTLPEDANFGFERSRDFGEEYSNYCYMVENGHFSKDVTYFKYFYDGGKSGYLFRSNTTEKLYYGGLRNDIDALGFFHVFASIPGENILVSYISSEEIYAKKKEILESDRGSKALRDMVSATQSTDNPVLIFYRLKTDY